MNDYLLLLISAILVNNFVLVQFLGLCPFMGTSKKLETAIGLALATTFVLTLSSDFFLRHTCLNFRAV
jgi:electron transport complex protein RnfA